MNSDKNKQYHSFDIKYAEEYGLIESILLINFAYWINDIKRRNLKETNFHDNHWWTFVTITKLNEKYKYLSRSKIYRALKSLIEQNVLITKTFNRKKYDRTIWYAFKDENKFLPILSTSSEVPTVEQAIDEVPTVEHACFKTGSGFEQIAHCGTTIQDTLIQQYTIQDTLTQQDTFKQQSDGTADETVDNDRSDDNELKQAINDIDFNSSKYEYLKHMDSSEMTEDEWSIREQRIRSNRAERKKQEQTELIGVSLNERY